MFGGGALYCILSSFALLLFLRLKLNHSFYILAATFLLNRDYVKCEKKCT